LSDGSERDDEDAKGEDIENDPKSEMKDLFKTGRDDVICE